MKGDAPSGEKYEILAEINMIPLIDVSLVLLIIFMVMTPVLMKSKISVDLPKVRVAENVTPQQKNLGIQILQNGDVFVDGVLTMPERLEQAISGAVAANRSESIMVEADKGAEFGRFVTVVEAARKVGVGKFGIAVRTEKEKKKGARR